MYCLAPYTVPLGSTVNIREGVKKNPIESAMEDLGRSWPGARGGGVPAGCVNRPSVDARPIRSGKGGPRRSSAWGMRLSAGNEPSGSRQ